MFLTQEGVLAITQRWKNEQLVEGKKKPMYVFNNEGFEDLALHEIPEYIPKTGSFMECTVWNAIRSVYEDASAEMGYVEFMERITPHCSKEVDEAKFNDMVDKCKAVYPPSDIVWCDLNDNNSNSDKKPFKKHKK
jgi:hypothetical protein